MKLRLMNKIVHGLESIAANQYFIPLQQNGDITPLSFHDSESLEVLRMSSTDRCLLQNKEKTTVVFSDMNAERDTLDISY